MERANFPLDPVELLLLAEFLPGPVLVPGKDVEPFAILGAGLQFSQPQGQLGSVTSVTLVRGIGVLAVELAGIEPRAQPFQRLPPPRWQPGVIDLTLDRRQRVRSRR